MNFTSYHPPLRFLMGAGPATLHPRVASALARPIISHMDKGFIHVFEEIQILLRLVMQTQNPMTIAVQGPGSLAMEMCIANLVEPGDKVIVMSNGIYGQRMFDMLQLQGAEIILLDHPWGENLSHERLEDALIEQGDVSLVCFVHGESSTGVMSDARILSKIAKKHGALVLCDIAATVVGCPVYVDEWGLDAVYSNAQKCFSAPPGLSPLSLSPRAMKKILNRKSPVSAWCLDLRPVHAFMQENPRTRIFPHTSPAHCYFALHEALLMIYEEGMEKVWKRHKTNAEALTQGLRALGCEYATAKEVNRIPLLNVIKVPKSTTMRNLREYLVKNYYLEISDGMGKWSGKTVRIAAQGQTSVAANILYCISSVGQALQHLGTEVNINQALDISRRYLTDDDSENTSHMLHSYAANGTY